MSGFALAVDAFKGCFRNWQLWLIQFLGNALLFALFTAWLFIPVATSWHLALNVLLALFLLAGGLVLHGGTLNYFYSQDGQENESLREVFTRGLWNLLAVAVCAVVLYLLWLLAAQTSSYEETLPPYFRSILPVFVRRHAGLPLFQGLVSIFFFGLRWILVPGLVLPLLASAATFGFRGLGPRGLRIWKKTVCRISYWAIVMVAVLLGVLATQKIMVRTSDFRASTLSQETVSVIVRSLLSYFLGLFAWMLACSAIGRQRQTLVNSAGDPDRQTAV
jgi:hypothetical protein